ncbi:unnamed protein product [Didymodactylos carnosus]|uniref:Uncharacterized protein n=1 Tax=Didymodactylos carnosus TaxID=1234261 RepID=A0A814UG40_9BILA|nr:unnamed protein product [Didymodactylos carnosus]CAF3938028.1 unnamed protein product [Didymodactylos carnosus]
MGDGAAGITSAMSVIPQSRRLMSWAHMIRKCREHRKVIPNEQKWLNVEKDIVNLQLCFKDNLFNQAASLLLGKWSLDNQLDRFRTYFEGQWINDLSFWYEGAVCLAPSTNNGLESLNGKIKQSYTMRNKLSLATFLQTAERMLRDWSTKSATDGFAHTIHFESDLESKAHQWSQKIDQSQIIRLSNTGYVIPTRKSSQINGRFVLDDDHDDYQRTRNEDFEQWLSLASPSFSKRALPDTEALPFVFTMFGIDDDVGDQFTESVSRFGEQEVKPFSDVMSGAIVTAIQPICPELFLEEKSTIDDGQMEMMKMIHDIEVERFLQKLNANDRNVFDSVFKQMKTQENAAKACKSVYKMLPEKPTV